MGLSHPSGIFVRTADAKISIEGVGRMLLLMNDDGGREEERIVTSHGPLIINKSWLCSFLFPLSFPFEVYFFYCIYGT